MQLGWFAPCFFVVASESYVEQSTAKYPEWVEVGKRGSEWNPKDFIEKDYKRE